MKSATMNKRMQRGYSRENDDNYDELNQNQQYHGYQGHLSNNNDMPPVNNMGQQYQGQVLSNTRQSKTSSGVRGQTWKNQQQ